MSAFRAGRVAESADKFEEASKLDTHIATIQLNLGFANLAIYQNAPKSPEGEAAAKKAIVAFEHFLQLKPDEERARVFLIQTFIDTGRYDDAVAFFKPDVEKSPPDGAALTTLGIIASKTGRFDEAKSWYEKQVALEPTNADARLAIGVLLWDHLHSHPEVVGDARIAEADAAIAHLGEAIKVKPNAPNAYTYTNLLYRERSSAETDEDKKRLDIEQAHKFYDKASALQKGVK